MMALDALLALRGWEPWRRQLLLGPPPKRPSWRWVLMHGAPATVTNEPYFNQVQMYPEWWKWAGPNPKDNLQAHINLVSAGTIRQTYERIEWREFDPMVLEILARVILAVE